MSSFVGLTAALVVALAAPAADEAIEYSPGIGLTVAEDLRHASPAAGAAESDPQPEDPERPISFAPRLPPPASDLARVQGSPRARGIHAAAAVAAQVAMLIAGVISVRNQNREVRERRKGQAQPYRPYR